MTPRSSVFALAFAIALATPAVSSGVAQPATASEAKRAGVASDPACALAPDMWKDRERWLRLEKGMSRFDVLRLLGDPGKVSAYDGFERWEYPGALGARVNFDDRGRVVGWIAP
jgi:hypothetical protein